MNWIRAGYPLSSKSFKRINSGSLQSIFNTKTTEINQDPNNQLQLPEIFFIYHFLVTVVLTGLIG